MIKKSAGSSGQGTKAELKRAEAPEQQQKPEGQTFESSLAALEKIVRDLERGDLPLEESLQLFEQGVRLSRQCQERLSQAERRIEVLLRDAEGRPLLSAFDDDEEGLRTDLDSEAGDRDESVF